MPDLLLARDRPAAAAERVDELAVVLRALGDPTRLRLLGLLAGAGGEACVCELTAGVGLSQPTVSHHLATLARAGLVTRDKRGVWAWYRTDPARLELVREVLADLAAPADRPVVGPVGVPAESARRGSCS